MLYEVITQDALENVPGVKQADVYLTSEKAVLQIDADEFKQLNAELAVREAGYSLKDVPTTAREGPSKGELSQTVSRFTTVIFLAVLLIRITSYNVCYTKLLRRSISLPSR